MVILAQFPQAMQYLGLQGDVQVGSGLVGDKRLGLERHSDSHHNALRHAAAELERVAVEHIARVRYAHLPQQIRRQPPRRAPAHIGMLQHNLFDLLADGNNGIERRARVLEYERNLASANMPYLLRTHREQLFAFV